MRDTFDRFQPRDRGRFGDGELADPSPTRAARANLVDRVMILQQERASAIAVTEVHGPQSQWTWLPKSLVEFERLDKKPERPRIRVTMPERLAREKGLA